MLLRVIALAVCAAVATVDVCAAPSDGPAEATDNAAQPAAPWTLLLKPDGEDGAPLLLRENSGANEPGPAQRFAWQSLTATLGFIAQALARIPIVWITGNASATSLPPPAQRMAVEPVALPTPTAPAAAPAAALDEWRDSDTAQPDAGITDVDVDEASIAVAQVFDDDSALGEGYKKIILEEILKSIANSLATLPVFSAEGNARAADTRNVALASEVHNTVQNNQPITNTFNIVENPGVSHAPHHPLVRPATISNSNSLKVTDGRFYRPRHPHRIAPVYNGCNGLASCVNSFHSKIVENTMDSIANSIMLFPNLIAGSGSETYPAYDTRDYGYRQDPYTTYVPKIGPTNNVAIASEVYNTYKNSQPIANTFNIGHRSLATSNVLENAEANNELTSCINNYEEKILKNTLKSVTNSMTSIPSWTATNTGEAYGTANVANAVAIDNGAYDTGLVADNSVAPVVEVVSPSYASEGVHKVKNGESQITQSFNDGLSSFIDNLESSIVDQTMSSIANSMAFPTWMFGNAATQSVYGSTGENIANAIAIDKEVTRPVIKTVRPSYVLKKQKISSLEETNTGSQVTDGLHGVIGSGNVANAVAIDDASNGNVIVDYDDSKSTTIDNTHWGVNDGAAYSGGSIANAVAIDTDVDVNTHPVIKIVRPSYVTNKNKLSSIKGTNNELKVTGVNSNFGVVGSENVANAIAIDEDTFGDKITFVTHDSESSNFKDGDGEIDESLSYSTLGSNNIANAVAIDELQDAFADKEIVNVQEETQHNVAAYPTYHTGNIATAVAIDDVTYDNKGAVFYDDSKFTNTFKEVSEVHNTDTKEYTSYTTGNVANAVAIDEGSTDNKPVLVFEDSQPTISFKPSSQLEYIGPAVHSTYFPWNIANAVSIDEDTFNDKKAVVFNNVVPVNSITETHDKDFPTYSSANIANAVAVVESNDGIQFDGTDNKQFIDYVNTNNEENLHTPVYSAFKIENSANAVAIDGDSGEDKGVIVDSKQIKPTDITNYVVGNIANGIAMDRPKTDDWNTNTLKEKNDEVDFFVGTIHPSYYTVGVANAVAIDDNFYDKVDDAELTYPSDTYDDMDYDTIDIEPSVNTVAVKDTNYEDESVSDENGMYDEVEVTDDNYSTHTSGNVANAVAIDIGGFKPSGSNLVPSHTTFISGEEPVKSQNLYKISDAGSLNVANAVAVDTDESKVHVGDSLQVSPSKLEEESYKSKIVKETLESIANSIIFPKWTSGVVSSSDFAPTDVSNVANAVAIGDSATAINARPLIEVATPFYTHGGHVGGHVKAKTSHIKELVHAAKPWSHGATNINNIIEGFKSKIWKQTLNSISNSILPTWTIGATNSAYDTTGSESIANAVAVDQKTAGSVEPVVKIVRPPYVVDKHKLSSYSGYGTGSIANAVAIDKGVNEFKTFGHTGNTDTIFFGTNPVNGGADYDNVANAVAIDGVTSDPKLFAPDTADFLEKAALPYATYYNYGPPIVANANAID